MMENALRTILRGVLDPDIFKELQLPVQPIEKGNPSLGLGLISAVSVSAASFLASAASSNEFYIDCLPNDMSALTTYNAAVLSHGIWISQCPQEEGLTLAEFCSPQPPSQHKITAPVHRQFQDSLPAPEQRLKCFRACMLLPGAKDWVYCVPAKGLKTHIKSREFRTWLQYFCQVPLFPPDAPCPRDGCPESVEANGDHLLHCRYGGFRIARHEQQVRLLTSDLSKAVRHPIMEPRERVHHRVRPDIAAIGTQGGTDYLDITFINPLAPSYVSVRHFNALSSLNSAHRKKQKHRRFESFIQVDVSVRHFNALSSLNSAHRKKQKHRRFESFIQVAGEATHLLPVPISAIGGWHRASHTLLKSISSAIATRAVEPFWKVRNLLF